MRSQTRSRYYLQCSLAEDVEAWELLWDARETYGKAEEAQAQGHSDAPLPEALQQAKESLLAAEGSDWCWWYGPEHSTANDAEFDALFRRSLQSQAHAGHERVPHRML